MDVAFEAMMFAREVHKDQKRKYTGDPYANHLAEVAGISAAIFGDSLWNDYNVAIAWLHDSMEDQGITYTTLDNKFGAYVADGVKWLSDLEKGNRAARNQLSRERLALAPDYIQTIKCADLISNTSSIVQHDPKFAKVYLPEKDAVLEVLTKADRRLWNLAKQQVVDGFNQLYLKPN